MYLTSRCVYTVENALRIMFLSIRTYCSQNYASIIYPSLATIDKERQRGSCSLS